MKSFQLKIQGNSKENLERLVDHLIKGCFIRISQVCISQGSIGQVVSLNDDLVVMFCDVSLLQALEKDALETSIGYLQFPDCSIGIYIYAKITEIKEEWRRTKIQYQKQKEEQEDEDEDE